MERLERRCVNGGGRLWLVGMERASESDGPRKGVGLRRGNHGFRAVPRSRWVEWSKVAFMSTIDWGLGDVTCSPKFRSVNSNMEFDKKRFLIDDTLPTCEYLHFKRV